MTVVFGQPNRLLSPQQAFGRSRIDWSHPILNGLSYLRILNRSRGTAPDFISNGTDGNLSDASTSPIIAPAAGGLGLSGDRIFVSSGSTYVVPNPAGTCVAYATAKWAPADGVYHGLLDLYDAGVGGDFAIIKYLDDNWYAGWNLVADNRAVAAAAGTFTAGESFSIAATWSSTAPQGTRFYTKGVLRNTNAGNPTSFATGSNFYLGGNASGNPWATTTGADALHYVAFWSRVLRADELALLAIDPYCFVLPVEGEMPAMFTSAGATFLAAWAQQTNLPVIGTGIY